MAINLTLLIPFLILVLKFKAPQWRAAWPSSLVQRHWITTTSTSVQGLNCIIFLTLPSSCRKLVQAEKRFTIKKPPNVLTIQLKRFTFTSFFGGKIDKLVTFQEYLDLAPYVSENKSNYSVNYSLYAVLVHSGSSTRSGHYYSFVKSSSGTWYCMDDNHVSRLTYL